MTNNIDIEKLKQYINDLDEQITPLTKKSIIKPKGKQVQDIPENPETVIEIPKKIKVTSEKKKNQLVNARLVKNANHITRTKQKKVRIC